MRTWFVVADGVDPYADAFRFSSTYSTTTVGAAGAGMESWEQTGDNYSSKSSTFSNSGSGSYIFSAGRTHQDSSFRSASSTEKRNGIFHSGSSSGVTHQFGTTTQTRGTLPADVATYAQTNSASFSWVYEDGALSNTYRYTSFTSFTRAGVFGNTQSNNTTKITQTNLTGTGGQINTGTALGTSPVGRRVTSTYVYPGTQTSYTIELGTLVTTTFTEDQTHTYAGYTYDRSNTTSVFGPFNAKSQYYKYVYEAALSEVLYSATTTGVGTGFWSDNYTSFTRTTITNYISQARGSPYSSGAAPSHVITDYQWDYTITETLTIQVDTYIPVTVDSFDGAIPPTATMEMYLYGFSTDTMELVYGTNTTAYTYNVSGACSFTSVKSFESTRLSTISFDGLTPGGGITTYSAVTWIGVPVHTTVTNYELSPGWSVTRYFLYQGNNDYYYLAQLMAQELCKTGAFQALSNYGPTNQQGLSLTADAAFYLDTRNTGNGAARAGMIPFNIYSTAKNGATTYSYSQDTAGHWSVTTDDGAATSSMEANVGIADERDIYNAKNPIYVYNKPLMFGGINPDTKVRHIVTFVGYGHRWTLGNTAGTSSYSTQLSVPYSTMDIGSSMIAHEYVRIHPYVHYTAEYPIITAMAYSERQ